MLTKMPTDRFALLTGGAKKSIDYQQYCRSSTLHCFSTQ